MVNSFVTKAELNASLNNLQDSLTNLNRQFEVLKASIHDRSPEKELIAFKSVFDDQIKRIDIQLQILKSKQPSQDVDKQLIAYHATFNDKVDVINQQMVVLRGNIKSIADDVKGYSGLAACRDIVDQKIDAINKQLQILKRKQDVLDIPSDLSKRLSACESVVDEKIKSINYQIQKLRSDIPDCKCEDLTAYKTLIDEQIVNITQQVQILNTKIENIQQVTQIDIAEEYINNILNQITQIANYITNIYQGIPFNAGRIVVNLTPGCCWEGTETLTHFNEDSRLVIKAHGRPDVVLHKPGKDTLFTVKVENQRSGAFDWVLFAWARCISGTVWIDYHWNRLVN